MHLYFLQHDPLLGPARLADWLDGTGHSHNRCRLDQGELPPPWDHFDALVLLDGRAPPEADLLKRERKLIDRALKSNKPLLGIGFGAELIAEALGAIVSPAVVPEFGWRTVTLDPASPFDLPETFDALLWHRNIFGLPEHALALGHTAQGPVQGFVWDRGRVIGLQCHLELTAHDTRRLWEASLENDTSPAMPVALGDELFDDLRRFDRQAALLDRILAQWLPPP